MAPHNSLFILVAIVLLSAHPSEQLRSSQSESLLKIQQVLNFPAMLSSWNNKTDFCNTEPNSYFTIVCYNQSISQLHIIGPNRAPMLPQNFSMHSFVAALTKLPDLKVLTLVSLGLWGPIPKKIARLSSLEIVNMSSNFLYGGIPRGFSSLVSLQTLILDDNMFVGGLPDWQSSSLSGLAVLSLRRNSLNGTLPDWLSSLVNLRVLALSSNHFYGELPDLSSLTNLQVLDLEDNALGPQFPQLGNKVVTLVLRKNRFRSAIPAEVSSFYQLQRFDISSNSFVGPFPPSLLSLPYIRYLSIAGNRLTGKLSENLSCNMGLEFVDLSSNLLSGNLPGCLVSGSKDRVALYARNCFALGDEDQTQHPFSSCNNEALAVGIIPRRNQQKQGARAVLGLSVAGGIVVAIALVGLVFLFIRRTNDKKSVKKQPTRLISEHASAGYATKIVSDSRYVSQSMKMGGVGLAPYRYFSLEELEEATNNFDTSAFMGEGSLGQMYRGQLKDGSFVAIRCLKMKRSQNTQSFMQHIELISKLRHLHLVSALGHCFECYLDDSSVSRIFLVFEYVPNGTLRSWISEGHARQALPWAQRIGAALGVAKGIQFLHTGIVPGVYSNNLKMTDILLDQNLVAKVSSYNLPLLAEYIGKDGNKAASNGSREPPDNAREKHEDKTDIYDFGVILLEMIVGRPFNSTYEVEAVRDQLEANVSAEGDRRSMVDPAAQRSCSDQSMTTMMEICARCLRKDAADRPSVEDVIWNLQFAAQVQDAWRGEYSISSEGSPITYLHYSSTRPSLTFH